MSDDALGLVAGGQKVSGWTNISVTLRAEGFPNSFDVSLTAYDPATATPIKAKAGDPCQIMLGEDLVITGYIDRDLNDSDPVGHRLRIVGRGKTQDLVDCSAEWPGGQIPPSTTFDIATKLASAYGITVRQVGDPVTTLNPQFNLSYGETGADIIQRLARAAGLLAYEDESGALVLNRAGSKKAATGISYGVNVQACSVTNAMDGRFSDIVCTMGSENILSDIGDAGFFFHKESDPNVPRHRLMYMPLEQSADPPAQQFTEIKAKWEVARRAGRATAVTVTVDSWRDGKGGLWRPNMLVDVAIPGLAADHKTLCIAQVTFVRNENEGTVATMELMPPAAFTPEPLSLQPVNIADVQGPSGQ